MEVEAWLNHLGLGQYAEAFGANDIDGETLPNLDGDDLKELGIASLGHRKKVLAAIDRLTEGDVTPQVPHESLAGGRRQVTILFANIAGFTRLSAELDRLRGEAEQTGFTPQLAALDDALTEIGESP